MPGIHTAAHLLTLRVIQSLGEGCLIGLFAAGFLRVFRQNAGARFVVWFASLIAIAAVPLVSSEWLWNVQSGTTAKTAITLPDSWTLYVLAGWVLLSSWFLLGVGKSLLHLRKLRNSCVEISGDDLDPMIQETMSRLGTRRRIALCTSEKVRVPTAMGLFRPAVVIPNWLISELSAEELNQILLHELAHLRRGDDWTNLVQQVVKAIFFFHPVVWWIEKKVALEREMACDDAVVAETNSPRQYATCLARLAERTFVHRSLAMAQAALGRVRETTERITRILDPNRTSLQSRILKPALSMLAAFAVVCGIWSARTSRLIAFDDGNAAVGTAAAGSGQANSMQVPAVFYSASKPLALTPAKLRIGPSAAKTAVHHSSALKAKQNAQDRAQLIHLAKTTIAPVPVTETVFVVIQNRAADPSENSGYQVQLWHVMVLRTVVNPAAQIPRKQI